MKFLLCVLLSSCAIQAMDKKADFVEETDCSSEQAEFDLDFEPDFDDWKNHVQGNSPSGDKKARKKKIKRFRAPQQNFKREILIEIVRQNLYRLGGIVQPATPEVAQSFLRPYYAEPNDIYHITCPVCFYKLSAEKKPARLGKQLGDHLENSPRHPFDGTSHYAKEWLKGRVMPLWAIMVANRSLKDLFWQGQAFLEGLPDENPYASKKMKSLNKKG